MIWVCRAGINAKYLEFFLETKKIYLPWEGYRVDLKQYETIAALKDLVRNEKGSGSEISTSNWAVQLYAFCWSMKINDYVLIPHRSSHKYTLGKIVGEYEYCEHNIHGLWHNRNMEVLKTDIPRELFNQSIRNSLGAYRTVFKPKNEEEILTVLGYL